MRFSFVAYICLLTVGLCAEPSQDPSSPSQILRDVAGKIGQVAEDIDDRPAPKPAEDWVFFPKEPVVAGRLAIFQIANDIADVRWVVISRSIDPSQPDPRIEPDSNNVRAFVETAVEGNYVVQAFGTRTGKTVYCVAEFQVVGTLPRPPPVVVTPPVDPVIPVDPKLPLMATYVYEKDDTTPSSALGDLLNRLNREKKVVATLFEQNTVDGDGETPDQYKLPKSESLKAGLPAWVVTSGDKVLKVLKDPPDVQVMWEAVP